MSLIVIEGLDGSGKGTQAERLFRYASEHGAAKKVTFPDYDSPSSALVQMYLSGEFGEDAESINAYAVSTFYAVDRFASFQTKWKTDYLAGSTVIADRYVTSNIVYQLSKLPRGEWDEYIEWLEALEYGRFGLPRPDRVLYLDVPPEVSQELLKKRYEGDVSKKDIHERDLAFLLHCRDCALYAAEKLGWCVISCAEGSSLRTIEDIHREILLKLEDLV